MSSKLNIGVVGIGRMGQRHALNILHHVPRARLLCVCSPAPHEIEWAEQTLKPEGVQVFADMEQMIQTPGLQAVVIASSSNLHITHTLAAMERGIHVLCEKPITTDVAEVFPLGFL
jgi:myo-inositol 2-dehydrogenase/D-chiro-inositol 1-dehydrogenase